MTTIQLTDEQRWALRDKRGGPIDVVDAATQQRYVLLAHDQFERVRPFLETGPEQGSSPGSPPTPTVAPAVGPLRQYVRDLPLPPEVAAEAKQYCKRLGWWGAKSRRQMEEQMKVQHYYGGMWIAILRTEEGPVVVAAVEDLRDPLFDQQLAFLTPEERRSVVIESPIKLFDDESQILGLGSDES